MPEAKRERADAKKTTEELKAERQSDATDDEVLKEEESRTATTGEKDPDRTPSPDGSFDEQRETDKAGPV